MIPITFGFLRVSDSKQDAASQRAAIQAWSEANRVTISGWIGKDAIHGNAEERPDIEEALCRARAGEYQRLIVSEQSRIGRLGAKTILVLEELTSAGIELISVAEGKIDVETEGGELISGLRALMAKSERRRIGARTRAACVLRDGVKVSARRGLKWGRPSITIAPETEAMIRAERAKSFAERKTWDELAKIVRGTVTRPDGSTASVGVSDNFLRVRYGSTGRAAVRRCR